MSKSQIWGMFVYRLAESEVQNLLQLEQIWSKSQLRGNRCHAALLVRSADAEHKASSSVVPGLGRRPICHRNHNGDRRRGDGTDENSNILNGSERTTEQVIAKGFGEPVAIVVLTPTAIGDECVLQSRVVVYPDDVACFPYR